MGQLTKEETKTETRKLPEILENDQQFIEEEQSKEYETPNPLTVGSESDDLQISFSNLTLSPKCSMKTVELASSAEESDSEEEADTLHTGEALKRGPTNGIPVTFFRNFENFTSSQYKYNENNSKRTCDDFEGQYYKYKKPIQTYNETYEFESSPSTSYTFSESSGSPDQNDNQNEVADFNQENTLDDLMAILQEDNNKNMYSTVVKEELCSSTDSHIRFIEETLKNGFEDDIKHIKSPSPPQCVPQLYDQHCFNIETTELKNINNTEQENVNKITAYYDQMSHLNGLRQIPMNKNIQEQVLPNSIKQNGTADGCSIKNAPSYMRQQFINDNIINFCNQGQIARNESNQSRPVRDSGSEMQSIRNIGLDKHTSVVGSGIQLHGLHNYGDKEQIIMNGCAGRQPPVSASSQILSRVGTVFQGPAEMNVGRPSQTKMNTRNTAQNISAGNQGRIMMNANNQNQVIMNAGIPNQAIVNAGSPGHTIANVGSPGQTIINAGSPGQTIMNVGSPHQTLINAGSPGQTIINPGSPGQTIMNAGSPGQTIMNAGSPGQTIMNAGSPGQTIMNAGSPGQTIMNAGSPGQTIMNAGSPGQTIMNAGSPGQTIMNAGSPGQTLVNVGSPGQTIMNGGSPGQTLVNVGSHGQTLVNTGNPHQTLMNAGSSHQTLMNDDDQAQIIINATSQAQSINGQQNWMNSIGGQNLPSATGQCSLNPSKSVGIAELVGQGGQVYPSQSQHIMINGTTPNLQNPAVVTQAVHNQPTTPVTLTSPAVSSTSLFVLSPPPLYFMPSSNALILVQKPQATTTKSSPKPILPKPPASDIKSPALDEQIFSKHFNNAKKGKNIFNADSNSLKTGASHQIIARRCVASRSDEELLAVDSDGNNYLHAAVCVTDVNMVKALLERIKRIKRLEIINDCNSINQTPLYLAVSYNKPAIVCELVRNGANPNVPAERRRSVLHCAATQGKEFNLTLKQLFESKKIDPNIKNADGLTALLCAIMEHGKIVSRNNKNLIIDNCVNVSLLLKNGADPEIYDGRNGMTPLMYAIESKDINLVEAIVKQVDTAKFQKMLLAKTFSERTCSMIAEELQNKYDPSVYRKLSSILSLNK